MDKISDFFYDLRDRVTNPLFVSFIIAWLVYNWQIPIGLIFYKGSELATDGYKSYIELISKNLEMGRSLWVPLKCSLLYTFVFPPIRLVIMAFLTWIKTISITWNLKIRSAGKVPAAKYFKVLRDNEEKQKYLSDLILKEDVILRDNATTKAQLEEEKSNVSKAQDEKVLLQNKLNVILNMANTDWLNGDWNIKRHIKSKQNGAIIIDVQRIYINNGDFFEYDKLLQQKKRESTIKNYFFNDMTKEVFFINKSVAGEITSTHRLSYSDSINELTGFENEDIRIDYERTDVFDK